jgi:hypothetical protein
VSSPVANPRRACADGSGRLRSIRARGRLAGLLDLVASLLFLAIVAGTAQGQFPVRQVPSRWTGSPPVTRPASSPSASSPSAGLPGTSPQAPAATAHPAICRITVPERDGVSYGSGTLIDARGKFGLVVTNWHVVRDAAGAIQVEFPDGSKSPAEVVRTDKDWDLAALSIFRPAAEPLPVTEVAPQKGDWLTIAGYGSGDYRQASGVCTQYLSPSNDLPYELIELATEARQGDSGGPILNQRGEICGVLLGSGPGYTTGSYGGRVRQFLATVVPGGIPGSDGSAANLAQNGAASTSPSVIRAPEPGQIARTEMGPPRNPLPGDTGPSPWTPLPSSAPQTTALHAQSAPYGSVSGGGVPVAGGTAEPPLVAAPAQDDSRPLVLDPPPRDWAESNDVDAKAAIDPRGIAYAGQADEPLEPAPLPTAPLLGSLPPRGLSTGNTGAGADLAQAPPDQLLAAMWRRFGGTTIYDQSRSVLAIIGCLAVLAQVWRIVNRPETPVIDD